MEIGTRVKSCKAIPLNKYGYIPIGTFGTIVEITPIPSNRNISPSKWYGFEIAFDGLPNNTISCTIVEVHVSS